MAKITQQTALIRALEAKGWTRSPKHYTGCVALEFPDREEKFFVGKSGSIRKGKTRLTAYPIIDRLKQQLLVEGGRSD